jgi:hypothetical protein
MAAQPPRPAAVSGMVGVSEVMGAALAAHAGLFPGPAAGLALAAGNSRARLWLADPGPAALLWDRANAAGLDPIVWLFRRVRAGILHRIRLHGGGGV